MYIGPRTLERGSPGKPAGTNEGLGDDLCPDRTSNDTLFVSFQLLLQSTVVRPADWPITGNGQSVAAEPACLNAALKSRQPVALAVEGGPVDRPSIEIDPGGHFRA